MSAAIRSSGCRSGARAFDSADEIAAAVDQTMGASR